MSVERDPKGYLALMLHRILNRNPLPIETQMDVARIICDNNSLISNETREQACLVLTLIIQNNPEMSNNLILSLNKILSQQSSIFNSHLEIYVLCANIAYQPIYFLTKTIFKDLLSLLKERSNEQIQNWLLWSFAIRIKYDISSNISEIQLKLLEKYLSFPQTSWSISYIIRKMTERNDEQISENIWYLLTSIIDSDKYDVGTYNNVFYALGNFFTSQYATRVPIECRQHVIYSLENFILKQNISTAVVEALKCMIINDNRISEKTSLKLKEQAQYNSQYLNKHMKAILNLLNDDKVEEYTIGMSKGTYSHIKTEKIVASKTMSIEKLQEKTIESQINFIDVGIMKNRHGEYINSNNHDINIEFQSHPLKTSDHLSMWRSTEKEIRNLLNLVQKRQPLTENDINYLIRKFSDKRGHYFVDIGRNQIYELIASTFLESTKNGQRQSIEVMNHLIHRLIDPNASSNLVRICSETFLEIVKHNQQIPGYIIEQLVDILSKLNDTIARKTILDILAINFEKERYDINISLETLENDLLEQTPCLATRYLFLRLILMKTNKISLKIFKTLCHVAVNQNKKQYHIDARRNCMATVAHSIENIDNKKSLLSTIQFCLIKAFEDEDDKIRLLALKTLYFYCEIECITFFHPCILNTGVYHILKDEINNQSSQQLKNITLLYLKAVSNKQLLLNEVLISISNLLVICSDYDVRYNVVRILKCVAETLQSIVLPSAVLVNVEITLDDPEFNIRLEAANIFLNNWQKNLIYFFKKSQKSISRLLTKKFNGHVHQHTLSILKKIVEQNHQLSNDLIELIAQFLFDHDITIVTTTADILLYHVEYHLLSQNIVDMIERILQNRSDQDTLIQILRKC
ncbi:unnamed protein product, partial [Rotaria sp. Silwood2]